MPFQTALPIVRHSAALAGGAVPIGRAAEMCGVSVKMIRYYEGIGLVRPAARSAGNYRTYDAAALRALRFIGRARQMGFSVAEIGRLLALWHSPRRSSADVKALALRHMADLDARIAALRGMRLAIAELAAHCHGDDAPDCPILDDLAGES